MEGGARKLNPPIGGGGAPGIPGIPGGGGGIPSERYLKSKKIKKLENEK